jgi:ABC-type multidrug transport system fused ATPase/permease subunit
MCGKTMVSVPQRLSAVRAADAIFVLDKGMVMASGTHDVLLREGGLYARLFGQETTE